MLKKIGIACGALVAIIVVIAIIVGVAGGGDGNDDVPAATDVPVLTEEQKSLAINAMMGQSLVSDAAITQDGRNLSLVLVVNAAASEEYAKELGSNFVRLVKTFGPEEAPGREIGEGIYDYLVGVYTPAEEQIALGAKVSFARSITW